MSHVQAGASCPFHGSKVAAASVVQLTLDDDVWTLTLCVLHLRKFSDAVARLWPTDAMIAERTA